MASNLFLRACAAAVLLFLYLPLAVVVIFSFNNSALSTEWTGFTWRWYQSLLANRAMLEGAANSLLIALASSAAATLLGTMAGLALYRHRLALLSLLVFAPVAMPEILLGVALLVFFLQALRLELGLFSVIVAHTTFSIGFVAVVVRARLAAFDESLLEAARDLGATPLRAFRHVTFPLILPGVVAGALLAFVLSLDDFVITFFTAGVGVPTLPLHIFTMIRVAVTPEVNAISTLLMLVTLTLIVIASRLAPDALAKNDAAREAGGTAKNDAAREARRVVEKG